jgi:hypothetical protein
VGRCATALPRGAVGLPQQHPHDAESWPSWQGVGVALTSGVLTELMIHPTAD